MTEDIILDLAGAPLSQAVINRLIGMANCSTANYKTLILRNIGSTIPNMIVDYGDLMPTLIKIISERENK